MHLAAWIHFAPRRQERECVNISVDAAMFASWVACAWHPPEMWSACMRSDLCAVRGPVLLSSSTLFLVNMSTQDMEAPDRSRKREKR